MIETRLFNLNRSHLITHVYPVLEIASAYIIQQRGLVQVHQGAWEEII